jgi:hypothetical protein
VNPKDDIREFLATRRARITPEQSGLPVYGANRRVFRQRWAAHDVRYHRTGTKRLHHPLVGDLALDFEALDRPGDEGQRLNVYTAPPDSPTAQALDLLASWTAREPTREETPWKS